MPPPGVARLSELEVDVDKDWGGRVIKNLGAPVDDRDSLRKIDLDAHKTATPLDHPDGSVTTAKLADGAVTTAKIADGAVTSAKIADGAVTSAKIGSSAVTTAKIADGAVTTAKLADGAVTAAKIASSAVTTAKIADGAVTTPKLADSAVTRSKIIFPLPLVDVMLESVTADPPLRAGRIWLRSDLGLVSYSPDGSTVRRIPYGTINVDSHASRHKPGGADPLFPADYSVLPSADNAYDLGSSSYRWRTVYAVTVYGALISLD